MLTRARLFFAIILLLTSGVALADPPVAISVDACFVGMAPRGGVYPIVVSIHNSGPSADGALIVKSSSMSDALRTYAYPVSLPQDTDKRIVAYPSVVNYADKVDFSFRGTADAKDTSLEVENRDGTQVGLIGDETGALSALRLTPTKPTKAGGSIFSRQTATPQFNDCYAKPEDAPDRAAGYQSLSVLVLAAGAERLRPDQWSAIRHWVLDGGSLILLGGAGATYLRVPDAAPLLPLVGLQDAVVTSVHLPVQVFDHPLPGGPVAVVTGTLARGGLTLAAQGGHIVLSRRAFGAGAVLLVGFNPLEQPFRDWTGQRGLWVGLLRSAAAALPVWSLRQWIGQQNSFADERTLPFGVASSRVRPVSQVNPFRVKLPPITTIAWLFLAYFILVVPITYVVLKRLGRLEWAWVTSPLISIAFAYAFYLFTAQLYQAGMSRRTAGVLVAAAGDPSAQFDGFSEIFFPHGGSYRVRIPGAEALELQPFSGGDPSGGAYYYSGTSSGTQMQPLATVDIGDVGAPNFQMGNLAFRRIYHTEPISLGGAVTATLHESAEGELSGTVRNGTSERLTGCYVYAPGSRISATVGDLAPGQSTTIAPTNRDAAMNPAMQRSPFTNSYFRRDNSRQASAYLVASMPGAQFGPALGRDVGGDASVMVLVSLPLSGETQP